MEYQAALDFVLSRTDYERWPGYTYAGRFDLRRMEELLHRLGDPHLGRRTIHIAGSKGKGSTAAMIASGLVAAGYRTGLYTSPHLHTIRERIAVDGKPISEGELAALVARLRPQADEVDEAATYGELTTFELLTALGFLHFQAAGADFQVLEAGLGGRLDATNVTLPEVCVITNISFDHTEVLGDTLEKIAREKAGIVKSGALVISSPQRAEAAAAIEESCRAKGAELIEVGKDITWRGIASDLAGQTLEVRGRKGPYRVRIRLLGDHQLENATTAVAALEAAGVSKEGISRGLAAAEWPGRLQVLAERPLLVVDGAHTPYSAMRLRRALERHFPFERLVLIIGASGDKDVAAMARELVPAERAIVTRSRHPRAAAPEAVAAHLESLGIHTEVVPDIPQAVKRAQAVAGEKDLICATGSLFVVAEVVQWVKGVRGEFYPTSPVGMGQTPR